MKITAKVVGDYNATITHLELTHTPDSWWERRVSRLKPKTEQVKYVAGKFWGEGGRMISGITLNTLSEEYLEYKVLQEALVVGMLKSLDKLTKSK